MRLAQSQHHIDPVLGIADHLRKFWDPGMRRSIVAYAEHGGNDLYPEVLQAVRSLGH